MSDDSTPKQSPATQQTIRWIILAVIVGVLVFNWWSDRNRPPVRVSDATSAAGRPPWKPTSEKVELDLPTESSQSAIEHESRTNLDAEPTPKPTPPEGSPPIPNAQKSTPPTKSSASQTQPPARGPPAAETKTKPADARKTASPTKPAAQPAKPGQPRVEGLKVRDVVIRNLDDEVVYRGTVDLAQTLQRIDDEKILSEFRHDGIEFKNLERRLPIKSRGYYREWVYPTSGQRGPGPQRVVTGKDGEAYYTWDHYEHFVRIRSGQ